jgi:peptidoglycan hydrolase-like protein with peptidoglycan-binding domain
MKNHAKKRFAVVAIALAATTISSLALASPALASTPHCVTTMVVATTGGSNAVVPAYYAGYDGGLVYSDNCVLSTGDSGDAVKALQGGINSSGQSVIVDGKFGPKTKAAVERIQRRAHISVDGVYGPQTRGKMCWPIPGSCAKLVG